MTSHRRHGLKSWAIPLIVHYLVHDNNKETATGPSTHEQRQRSRDLILKAQFHVVTSSCAFRIDPPTTIRRADNHLGSDVLLQMISLVNKLILISVNGILQSFTYKFLSCYLNNRWPLCFMKTSSNGSMVTGWFPSQRPVTRSFDAIFDLRLNKRLTKQSRRWWFETQSCSLWRHCNVKRWKMELCLLRNHDYDYRLMRLNVLSVKRDTGGAGL